MRIVTLLYLFVSTVFLLHSCKELLNIFAPVNADHHRYLQTTALTSGTCAFFNSFSNSLECATFRGDNWTTETMQLACNGLTGTLTASTTSKCPVPSDLAGYCIVSQSGLEAASALSGECEGTQNLCESMFQGTFEPASKCGGDGSDAPSATESPTYDGDRDENVTGAFPDFGDDNSGVEGDGESSSLAVVSGQITCFIIMTVASMIA